MLDEFDSSLHPTAVEAIINLFHDDAINVNKAQLIFNTHNPAYLNRFLCRRDELKFVEKRRNAQGSEHWSLSDFGTKGPGGVRSGDNFMRDYLRGSYGAIERIRLDDIMEDTVNRAGETEH